LRRRLLRSPTFVRAAQRLLRKKPSAAAALQQALTLLAEDAFHPKLRTHKLKGKLLGGQRWIRPPHHLRFCPAG
jgi:mRNA-degrading endonuclease YafQ of YafQ-DinJ toxin-antitoxin module